MADDATVAALAEVIYRPGRVTDRLPTDATFDHWAARAVLASDVIADLIAEAERDVLAVSASGAPMPDRIPETVCRRCLRPNVWSWHAPSPVWNAVMRADDKLERRWSIICPPCFAELAEGKGFHHAIWHFAPHDGWETRLPLINADGLRWDSSRCLWVAS